MTEEKDQVQTETMTENFSQLEELPRFNVILWNDDDHTFEYVVRMMKVLFRYSLRQGFLIARKVDREGRAIVQTTHKEEAELRRDLIRAFGADPLLQESTSSMYATIEPVPEE